MTPSPQFDAADLEPLRGLGAFLRQSGYPSLVALPTALAGGRPAPLPLLGVIYCRHDVPNPANEEWAEEQAPELGHLPADECRDDVRSSKAHDQPRVSHDAGVEAGVGQVLEAEPATNRIILDGLGAVRTGLHGAEHPAGLTGPSTP